MNPSNICQNKTHWTRNMPYYHKIPIVTKLLVGNFCHCSHICYAQIINLYSIGISLSAASLRLSRSPATLSGAPAVSTSNAEGPGRHGSVHIIEVDRSGDEIRI